MMKPLFAAMLAAALTFAVRAEAADKLNIVTTTSDLASLAKAVAGDLADVSSICTGQEDPHFLSAKPSFIARARTADLWIDVGLELESAWEQPILTGSRNARIQPGTMGHLDLSKCVEVLEVPQVRVTRAMGDVHPGGNPHYWLDPLNGRRMVDAIAARLADLSPANAGIFQTNARAFQRELDERMFGTSPLKDTAAEELWAQHGRGESIPSAGGWAARMAPLRGTGLVTYHKSWIYFANRFGMRVVGELEPKPGIPPTAAHLSDLMTFMKAEGVTRILQEPFYITKAANHVAAGTGARVIVAANSVGGQPQAANYLEMVNRIVEEISK